MSDDEPLARLKNSTTNEITAAIPRIDSFIDYCREKNVPVIWTQMIESPELSPENIANKMRSGNTPAISSPGTPGFDFLGQIPKPNDKVIIKKYYDAFAETDLFEYLSSHSVVNVIIVGGYTSKCILGTSFGANNHGLNVYIPTELVSNVDSELNEAAVALEIIDGVLGYVVSVNDIIFE
jgi:nicotinamidase-related amidase